MNATNILARSLATALIFSTLSTTSLASDEAPMECGIPLDVYEATSNPVPEGIIYEYVEDENGNYVLVEEIPDLTDAFDPEGDPMPEGAFASPDTTNRSWFSQLLASFLGLFA
ncbi:MAG: hypothetical protein R3Y07_02995 [Eubacteriales bacterium]